MKVICLQHFRNWQIRKERKQVYLEISEELVFLHLHGHLPGIFLRTTKGDKTADYYKHLSVFIQTQLLNCDCGTAKSPKMTERPFMALPVETING